MPACAPTRWKMDDLDYSRVAREAVRDDQTLFYLACSASFIESGSDMYTHNLIEFFRGDDEVTQWLTQHWEPEELQHGRALRAYVEHVWPEFDWERGFRSFIDEYRHHCKVELLEPTRALEMSARCVVETGTATYYRALSRSTNEPFFVALTGRIAADEVNHYKHFYRFFRRYRDQEGWAARACCERCRAAPGNCAARTPTARSATSPASATRRAPTTRISSAACPAA